MTFLIATACADWYYGIEENYYSTGIFRLNRYHIGSFTFGAMIVTIINMLKRAAQEESGEQAGEGNAAIACCLCIIACCLSCIEDLFKVLNHNSIIVMAVTGESYWDSAKTTIGIIFENFGLFYIVDFISDLVVFFGILASVGIPTIVGILILTSQTENGGHIAYSAVAIFFLSLMIASMIISMVGEALSCVFIFYCFDKKFKSMGIYVPNTPSTIQEFHEHESGLPSSAQNLR